MTLNDDLVLDAIFNPTLPPLFSLATEQYEIPLTMDDILYGVEDVLIKDESYRLQMKNSSWLQLSENHESNVDVNALEQEALAIAEENPEIALDLLNRAVGASPRNPSLYNNRAQVHRLTNQYECAYWDTCRALYWCMNSSEIKDKNVAPLAYCQRALIRGQWRRQSPDDKNLEKHEEGDWLRASKHGSRIAQKWLASRNPYAAMCQDVLRPLFEKLQQPCSL